MSDEEYAEQLDPKIKERADSLIDADKDMMSMVVHTSFVAGMQLAIRICRNRADQIRQMGTMMTIAGNEAQNCAALIRICQVEIGAGRMDRPKFTAEELEEMDRIS